jgi:Nitrile hydratase beta subunit, N-terminal
LAQPPIDPETALPWQKLGAALADLLRAHLLERPGGAGLDVHEARVQAVADLMIGRGVLAPAELERRMAGLASNLAGDKDRAHPKARFSNARPNDIGGLPGGPVDPRAGAIEDWELLAVALGGVLGQRGLLNLHERRRAVEDLGEDYHRLGYFQRMVQGQANLLYEKGVLTRAEVERRIGALKGGR